MHGIDRKAFLVLLDGFGCMEHALRDIESPTIGDKEEAGFGDRSVGKAMPHDLEFFAVLVDRHPVDMRSRRLGRVRKFLAITFAAANNPSPDLWFRVSSTARDCARKEAAEQLRQSRDDKDASRIAQETIDFFTPWFKSFQTTAGRPP